MDLFFASQMLGDGGGGSDKKGGSMLSALHSSPKQNMSQLSNY